MISNIFLVLPLVNLMNTVTNAPIMFTLCSKVNEQLHSQGCRSITRWNNDLKEEFRKGIIGQLPKFNSIILDIDNENTPVDSLVSSFTNTIRDVADPLFHKTIQYGDKNNFSSVLFKNKEWFDHECRVARGNYKTALNVFLNCKTAQNREESSRLKKCYKTLLWKKKKAFEASKIKEIEKLKKSKPKDFWRYFRKNKNSSSSNITLDDFKKYFIEIGTDFLHLEKEEAECFVSGHNFDESCDVYEELDKHITVQEILDAVKLLKTGKNEYFIECIDVLAGHICDIFNKILDSGHFPEKWCEGIIVPIYKKGNKADVNNYRGITILSCLSKIFTIILNRRITSISEENNLISDSQFGFRKGKSTVDALFVLLNVVHKFLNENKRLYCVFVDFKKAFDSVYRNALWLKLYRGRF